MNSLSTVKPISASLAGMVWSLADCLGMGGSSIGGRYWHRRPEFNQTEPALEPGAS